MFVPIIEAHAQAQLVVPTMNRAIGALVYAKLATYGIPASDPRAAATVRGIQVGLNAIATGAVVAGEAVTWPVLLGAAGVAAFVAGALYIAKNQSFAWTYNPDGSITSTGAYQPSYPALTTNQPLVKGGAYYAISAAYKDANGVTQYGTIYTSSGRVAVLTWFLNSGPQDRKNLTLADLQCQDYATATRCAAPCAYCDDTEYVQNGSPVDAASGYLDSRPPPPPVTTTPVNYSNADNAAKALPDSVAKGELNPAVVAAAVNAAWKNAQSANDSGGVPWSASSPITADDVSSWASSSAGGTLSVSDFTASAGSAGSLSLGTGSMTAPATGTSAGSGTSTGTGTGTGTTTGSGTSTGTSTDTGTKAPVTDGTGTTINWGPNPNVGVPNLEDTPTTASILDPIFNILPEMRNFSAPSHQSECPTASFTLYGKLYTLDSHCSLFEKNRSVLATAMLLAFSIAALFIVLRA
jgi:hypothetical protein